MHKYGDRLQVWNGEAEMTRGGLRKGDLKQNPRGQIVSAKRSEMTKDMHRVGGFMPVAAAGGSAAEAAALSLAGAGAHSRVAAGGFLVQGAGAHSREAEGGFLVQGAGAHSREAEGGFLVQGAGAHSREAEGGFLVQGAGTTGGAKKKRASKAIKKMGGAADLKEDAGPDGYEADGVKVDYLVIPENGTLGTNPGDYAFTRRPPEDLNQVRLFMWGSELCAFNTGKVTDSAVYSVANADAFKKKIKGGSIIDDIISLL